jgi:hypothetical protein
MEGRKTMTCASLLEAVTVGTANECSMKITKIVVEKIQRLEALSQNSAGSRRGNAVNASKCVGSDELMTELLTDIRTSGGLARSSLHEQFYWISRSLTVVTLLFVLYFLFIHE